VRIGSWFAGRWLGRGGRFACADTQDPYSVDGEDGAGRVLAAGDPDEPQRLRLVEHDEVVGAAVGGAVAQRCPRRAVFGPFQQERRRDIAGVDEAVSEQPFLAGIGWLGRIGGSRPRSC
jgi:hypothetical protein